MSAPRCGETITTDLKLRADLIDCPGVGLVIGADNITVDLNGHTIDGDNTQADCPSDSPCDIGVSNLAGHDGVIVRGGVIRQFAVAVFADGAGRIRLRQLTVRNNFGVGIVVVDSTDAVIQKNRVTGTDGTAVVLVGVRGGTVENNTLDHNNHGIAAANGSSRITIVRNVLSQQRGSALDLGGGATGNRVEGNRLTDNGDGIVLEEAHGNLISGNQVTGSGTFGFPDTAGFGIVIDGGDRNKLVRNTVTGGRGPAIFVATLDAPTAAEHNIVARNVASSRQYDGIFVDGNATATVLERNITNHNGGDGIHVYAPTTTLTRNTADYNHDLGIEAVPGVTDGGGNHAAHNGNHAQCTNVVC
ncbi:right-handed parallel beta-helix repeat-containing protein [Kribbella ginsengisoli]|uniref:right-handed parallel beta-helix repeat-containing protein n=1 Tax=Kribbella ginsengisoli TaxID=363865 RepID=UPI0031E3DC68